MNMNDWLGGFSIAALMAAAGQVVFHRHLKQKFTPNEGEDYLSVRIEQLEREKEALLQEASKPRLEANPVDVLSTPEYVALRSELQDRQSELAAATARALQAESLRDSLQVELNESQKLLRQGTEDPRVQDLEDDISTLVSQLEESELKRRQLEEGQTQAAPIASDSGEIMRLEAELAKATNERDQAWKDLSALARHLEAQPDSATALRESKNRIQELEAERDMLLKQFDQRVASPPHSMAQPSVDDLATLGHKITELENKLELQAQESAENFKARLNQRSEEIRLLQHSLASAHAKIEHLQTLVPRAASGDRLEELSGMTPEMAKTLRDSGILSYRSLSGTSTEMVAEILGFDIHESAIIEAWKREIRGLRRDDLG